MVNVDPRVLVLSKVNASQEASRVVPEVLEVCFSNKGRSTACASDVDAKALVQTRGGDDEEMQRFVPIEDLFRGRHFDRQIIIWCVSWYTSFKLSLRDLALGRETPCPQMWRIQATSSGRSHVCRLLDQLAWAIIRPVARMETLHSRTWISG
jgi:hypothetical protein